MTLEFPSSGIKFEKKKKIRELQKYNWFFKYIIIWAHKNK